MICADPWSIKAEERQLNNIVTALMDLGSVSTGYSDKPVARAIKIKHAGFNLTGQELDL